MYDMWASTPIDQMGIDIKGFRRLRNSSMVGMFGDISFKFPRGFTPTYWAIVNRSGKRISVDFGFIDKYNDPPLYWRVWRSLLRFPESEN